MRMSNSKIIVIEDCSQAAQFAASSPWLMNSWTSRTARLRIEQFSPENRVCSPNTIHNSEKLTTSSHLKKCFAEVHSNRKSQLVSVKFSMSGLLVFTAR